MRPALALAFLAAAAPGQALLPPPVGSCGRFVQVTPLGTMPASSSTGAATNAAAPVALGSALLLVDQRGFLYRRDPAGAIATLFAPQQAPAGLLLAGEQILNAAANAAGDRVHVVFTSLTAPAGVPVAVSPRHNADAFQVVCEYHCDSVALTQPRALIAFEVNATGHTGGGLLVLDDGSLLFAIGDNGDSGQDGLSFPQDSVSHLGKIVRIRPDGSWSIAAQGVRNVQRLEFAAGRSQIVFVDIGGRVAEEFDAVEAAALLDPARIENFGWGRNADGRAREGTFYIDPAGFAVARAPDSEPGFLQPLAQWGREQRSFVAGCGPVAMPGALAFLCGDLVSGEVYALPRPAAEQVQDLGRVALCDAGWQPTTLAALAGGRPDPRFFRFPDGAAGVLLERTGGIYRLDELPGGAAAFEVVGAACGPPSIAVDAPPRLQSAAIVRLRGGSQGLPALLLASTVRAIPPIGLGAIGMDGCALHLQQPAVLGIAVFDAVGDARWSIPIPGSAAVCGAQLFVQAGAAVPGLNRSGLAASELLVLRAGL